MSDTNTPAKKFSFAKPGAAAAQPVTPAPTEENPAPAGTPETPQNLPANVPPPAPPAFYTGEEDEPFDPADQRLPRLNIVQKSSQAEWLQHGVGSLLLKGSVVIAKTGQPFRMVVVGARPKIWIEKTKYGSSVKPRFARTIDEVAQFGGTDQWKFSKENPDATSNKPWFMPSVTLAVLVEKPANCAPEHEDHFAFVAGDKAYAAALLSVKSTNYEAVWVTLSSERRGLLSEGFNSRIINGTVFMKQFKGGESGVFKLSFGEKTSPELREIAHRIATGN